MGLLGGIQRVAEGTGDSSVFSGNHQVRCAAGTLSPEGMRAQKNTGVRAQWWPLEGDFSDEKELNVHHWVKSCVMCPCKQLGWSRGSRQSCACVSRGFHAESWSEMQVATQSSVLHRHFVCTSGWLLSKMLALPVGERFLNDSHFIPGNFLYSLTVLYYRLLVIRNSICKASYESA